MGILENSGLKQDHSKLRKSLYLRWYNMMDRCYNPLHQRYSDYGGNGVTVEESWKNFETFLSDVKFLPGFDPVKILEGGMHLDKDSIKSGNKTYSRTTCCFLSVAESNRHIPSRMVPFVATSPDGKEFESYNQTEFASQHGLRQSTIADCLTGRVVKHKGWTFRYKE